MADQAKVASIDSLESFRNSLVIFMERVSKSIDEVGDTVRRTRHWVQDEQYNYWISEKRRRERKLEQAEQELYSSRLSTLQDASTEAQMNVRRANRSIEEVEEKIRLIKKWARDYDSTVEPLARKLDALQDLVTTKYPKAVNYLVRTIETLESYAQVSLQSNDPTETPKSETKNKS
jgi:DNA repair ATPase RecN